MTGLRVSLLQQPLVPLETYRQKFPAHLDADRFTLQT